MSGSYGDTVTACPECDKPAVTPRQGWSYQQEGSTQYRCKLCGAHFDEPNVRERRGHDALTGLAKKLDEMDPDDLVGGTA